MGGVSPSASRVTTTAWRFPGDHPSQHAKGSLRFARRGQEFHGRPEQIDALSDHRICFSIHDFHSKLPYSAAIAPPLVRSRSSPPALDSPGRKAGLATWVVAIMAWTWLASRGSLSALCGLRSVRTSKRILSVSGSSAARRMSARVLKLLFEV